MEKILQKLMGPDWTPPTEEECAALQAEQERCALMRRTFRYYTLDNRARANGDGRVIEFTLAYLQGRNRTSTDQSGRLVHAVEGGAYAGFHAAVCGAEPGRRSGGWSEAHWASEATCPRCTARLAKASVRRSAAATEYIRADVARRISDQLVEAHQRIDELLAERAELLAETERLRALVEGE